MRITSGMMRNNMLNGLYNNTKTLDTLYNQMNTQKKIQRASEDPIVAARSMKLQINIAETTQHKANTKDATSWMSVTESALSNVNSILTDIRTRINSAANGTLEATDKEKLLNDISQLYEQLQQEANVTYSGRYVFSGYKTDEPVYLTTDKTYSENVDVRGNMQLVADTTVNAGTILQEGTILEEGSILKAGTMFEKDSTFKEGTVFSNTNASALGVTGTAGEWVDGKWKDDPAGSWVKLTTDQTLPADQTLTADETLTTIITLTKEATLAGDSVLVKGSVVGGDATLNADLTITRPAGKILREGTELAEGTVLKSGTILKQGTNLNAGTVLANGTVLGEGTSIKAGTALNTGTVLGTGTILGAGTTLVDTTVLPNGTVLGKGTTLNSGTTIPAGTVIGSGTVLQEGTTLTAANALALGVGDGTKPITLKNDVKLTSDRNLAEDLTLNKDLTIGGNTTLGNNMTLSGDTTLGGITTLGGNTTLVGNTVLGGNTLGGETVLGTDTTLNGAVTLGSKVVLGKGTTQLAADTTLKGNVTLGQDTNILTGSTLTKDSELAGSRLTATPTATLLLSKGTINPEVLGQIDGQSINYEIGVGTTIDINTLGMPEFMAGILQDMQTMTDDLQDNIDGKIQDDELCTKFSSMLDDFDGHLSNVAAKTAEVGSKQTRLNYVTTRLTQDVTSFKELLTNVEGVDLEETYVELSAQKAIYDAALNATAKIIQKTLADYI